MRLNDGHLMEAMPAGLPLLLRAKRLPAVEFAAGDVLRHVGDPSLGDHLP
jgi:hypothetical protein